LRDVDEFGIGGGRAAVGAELAAHRDGVPGRVPRDDRPDAGGHERGRRGAVDDAAGQHRDEQQRGPGVGQQAAPAEPDRHERGREQPEAEDARQQFEPLDELGRSRHRVDRGEDDEQAPRERQQRAQGRPAAVPEPAAGRERRHADRGGRQRPPLGRRLGDQPDDGDGDEQADQPARERRPPDEP